MLLLNPVLDIAPEGAQILGWDEVVQELDTGW
jgi:hypothetical protein